MSEQNTDQTFTVRVAGAEKQVTPSELHELFNELQGVAQGMLDRQQHVEQYADFINSVAQNPTKAISMIVESAKKNGKEVAPPEGWQVAGQDRSEYDDYDGYDDGEDEDDMSAEEVAALKAEIAELKGLVNQTALGSLYNNDIRLAAQSTGLSESDIRKYMQENKVTVVEDAVKVMQAEAILAERNAENEKNAAEIAERERIAQNSQTIDGLMSGRSVSPDDARQITNNYLDADGNFDRDRAIWDSIEEAGVGT